MQLFRPVLLRCQVADQLVELNRYSSALMRLCAWRTLQRLPPPVFSLVDIALSAR